VNVHGEAIGVNAAIDARAQGIVFAIPIDNVKSILPQLEEKGSVKRGFIGIAMTDIDSDSAKSLGLKETEGALITQVMPKSPASAAGLQPYDLIIEFDGKKITSSKEMMKSVLVTPTGKKSSIKVLRDGKPRAFTIAVGNTPSLEKVEK
jgi:serine protease Do